MKVEQLQVNPSKAHELWRKYQSHRVHQTAADAEIEAIYKRIAQGKTVIRALESIRAAGVDAKGLPLLAIARADAPLCYWHPRGGWRNRGAHFNDKRWPTDRAPAKIALQSKTVMIDWPEVPDQNNVHEAIVPLIPVHLRPKRGLANYHILWEAEWTKRYPVDPFLLRRFGGDAWLVVAAWDLTEVERAVMSSRLRS
jgi:hypothetical protein